MSTFKILIDSNYGIPEDELISKGYRHDIYVMIDEKYFAVSVYTLTRLTQDFETEIETYGYFAIPVNLVLVNETSIVESKQVLTNLFQKEIFFTELKSLADEGLSELSLSEI